MPLECIRTTGVCPNAIGVHQNHCGVSQNATGVYQNHWVCQYATGVWQSQWGVSKCQRNASEWMGGGGGGRSRTTGLPPSIFACVKTLLECVRCHWRVRCHTLECTRHCHWSVSDATGVGQSYWISSDATVECRVLLESVRAMSDATGVSGASHWRMPDTITGVRQMPLECVRLHWTMSHSSGIHWSVLDTTGVCQMHLGCVRLHRSMSHSNGIQSIGRHWSVLDGTRSVFMQLECVRCHWSDSDSTRVSDATEVCQTPKTRLSQTSYRSWYHHSYLWISVVAHTHLNKMGRGGGGDW